MEMLGKSSRVPGLKRVEEWRDIGWEGIGYYGRLAKETIREKKMGKEVEVLCDLCIDEQEIFLLGDWRVIKVMKKMENILSIRVYWLWLPMGMPVCLDLRT